MKSKDILEYFFGFYPDGPQVPPPVGSKLNFKKAASTLGDNELILDSSGQNRLMAFVDYHIRQQPLPDTLWDGMSVITPWSKVYIRLHQKDDATWYIIEPRPVDEDNDNNWMIVLSSAAAALFLVRLYEDFSGTVSRKRIVDDLLANGIPFHTCISRPKSLPAPARFGSLPVQGKNKTDVYPVRSHAVRPWYPNYWTATRRDFEEYEQRRDALLSLPHIRRAALMHGGLIWRLALGDADCFDTVSAGPMRYAARAEYARRIPGFEDSQELVDDGLSAEELSEIMGAYAVRVRPGNDPRCKMLSWWPRVSEWTGCVMYSEIWTAENEKWYQRHLAKLKAGQVQPQRWESLPGMRQTKKVREWNNKVAAAVISDAHIQDIFNLTMIE